MKPHSGPKKQTQTKPILSAVGGLQRPKSLAGKSGHTRFCSWSDLRLQLWESSSSINNQTLIYELNHGYAKTYYERGKNNHEEILDFINVPLPLSSSLSSWQRSRI